MKITSDLFQAYLKCPMKCWLRAAGEVSTGNTYAEWVKTQDESYLANQAARLVGESSNDEVAISPEVGNLKSVKWQLATSIALHAQVNSCAVETCLHAVVRAPSEVRGKAAQFIPIRFIFRNKLTRDDRLPLALDAFALSEMLGRTVNLGKIIHGDDHATLKVKTSALAGEVRKRIEKMAALLSSPAPPDLVLNRHCAECEFQSRCRKIAIEKDDLSLLANMSAKERQKLRSKGIFTITQLSYTFRPRRRPKRLRDKREKYHHSLKALAIREQKIHIVGSPELKIEGTPVYLDVEGLPDRGFYYLIGLRIGHGESAVQRSLWADTVADEGKIWREFLAILETIEKPVLIHYGSYETAFLETLNERYGNQPRGQSESATKVNSINLLSELLDEIYFPTFSNGLKDIGAWLGFTWSDESPVGVRSIACRYDWERTRDVSMKERLIAYNTEDCLALEIVTHALLRLQVTDQSNIAGGQPANAVYVRSLKPPRKRFGPFISPVEEFKGITETAWWNYQRDRIYLKSEPPGKRAAPVSDREEVRPRKKYRLNTVVKVPVPASCPSCGGACVPRTYKRRTLQDLNISKSGIKRWVVEYKYRTWACAVCQRRFSVPHDFWPGSKFGRNLVAYLLYESFDLGIPIWTVSKTMLRFFGFEMPARTLYALRDSAAKYYRDTFETILKEIVGGNLLHIDETQVSVEGKSAYVWVFANLERAAFVYAESRDGCFLQEMLKDFKGVLVTDFYGAYDSLPCRQQKCLIHLMRDLNDAVLCNPYDEELKNLAREFGRILKAIVETVHRRGLQARYLRKHIKTVGRFYKALDTQTYQSEVALKCKQRFEKNRNKLFTFLNFDGIPWHNNNAEHAVKAFAKLRDIVRGSFTPGTIQKHLVLLSVCQTCKYMGADFLDFLRSGEKDIHAFAESRRGRRKPSPASVTPVQS
jgi:predicted RecB family nuclease